MGLFGENFGERVERPQSHPCQPDRTDSGGGLFQQFHGTGADDFAAGCGAVESECAGDGLEIIVFDLQSDVESAPPLSRRPPCRFSCQSPDEYAQAAHVAAILKQCDFTAYGFGVA